MRYKIPGYIVFFIACVGFSLYIQFPAQMLADYIEKQVSITGKDISIRINALAPSLPWGVKADAIYLSRLGNTVARFEKAVCAFDMSTLFSENRRVHYKAELFNGLITGSAIIEKGNFETVLVKTRFENILMENLDTGDTWSHCKLSGLLNGSVDAVLNNGMLNGNQGEITISDLVLGFSKPVYAIEQFAFSRAELRFNMPDYQVIRIENLKMAGRQLDITASGDITLAPKLVQSSLNMKTRIILYPLFFMNAGDASPVDVTRDDSDNAVFKLQIGGTIQNPLVTLDKDMK
jgi:type II secretion system protein N